MRSVTFTEISIFCFEVVSYIIYNCKRFTQNFPSPFTTFLSEISIFLLFLWVIIFLHKERIMANCPISPSECIKQVGTECLLPPVKRHINYWWCFDDNIQGLGEEIRRLKQKRLNIDQKIEEGRLRAESPTEDIQNWLKVSNQKLEEATGISQGCNDLKAWHIFSRYTVGKNAKKMAEDLEKLGKDGESIRIADPAPTPSMVSISHEPTMEFESRRRIEENIMEYLNDDHVSLIAICGAGGVGKTTMAKRIENRVRKGNIFDEVVMVVVSQQIDLSKIQKEVAELLGLKFSEDTLAARAPKLHRRLLDSNKKLIIFDDIWEYFDMSKIGVPFGNFSASCKIILTSRVKNACEKMNAQKVIPLEGLNENEAWSLFIEKAGSYVEGSDLRPIAEAVAAECKCLPIALVTVGGALKNKSIQVWRDSLSQLRRSIPTDFPEVIKDVYKPLKLSYDFLKNESLESLFLLCCLFPEDYNIPIELLTLYGIGLGIFKGIRNIEEGRNRTYNFVEQLKSRFLLMNGSQMDCSMEEHYVKMHDVVRDVAIFIASEEKHGFLKSLEVPSMDSSSKDSSHNCNWMSTDISIENTKLPFGLDFPNLRLLMILGSTESIVDANVICFKGMEELNVLSLSRVSLEALPPTLRLLKKLRTLHLHECWVKDISFVGELANLEILCIQYCYNTEEAPENIWRLNRLRFLELSYRAYCETVVVVSAISSLIELEELKIDCFDFKWEAKVNQSEERNGSLSVLESLPSLKSLQMHVSENNFVAQEIPLSQKLVKYRICSGLFPDSSGDMEHERNIALDLPGDVRVGNWIHRLVRSSQSLHLRGDGSSNFNLAEIASLRRLTITDCSAVKKLVDAIDCKFFPVLEHLELREFEELESIIDGTIPEGSNSFENLKSLIVGDMPKLGYLWKSLNQNVSLGNLVSIRIVICHNLRYLFSVAIVRSLVQLQHLEIRECWAIEQVFWNEMENNTDACIIELPKLQEMRFEYLPNLAAFSQGVEIVDLPQITTLEIISCPKLRFKIGKWNIKLQELKIWNNEGMEEILWGDEIRDEGERHIIFPELRVLALQDLPRLTTFCKGVESIKFSKLETMIIGELARMNSLLLPLDSEATHDQHCLHFFCNQKVEILGLEELEISHLKGNISKIWCHLVPINFFHNLKALDVKHLVGITNLMASSIAKNLVNLHRLSINSCPNMVLVIEDEKEVFVTSLFPNLRKMSIGRLPELKSFCHWENAFELPSL